MDIPILAYMYKGAVYESAVRCPLAHGIIRELKEFDVCVSPNHVRIKDTDYSILSPYTVTEFIRDLKEAAARGYDYSVIRTITLTPYRSKYYKYANT